MGPDPGPSSNESRVPLTGPAPAREYPAWLRAVLAVIFLYLSIDESAQIHELINPALTDSFNLGGVFYFSWVIPFGSGTRTGATAWCRC